MKGVGPRALPPIPTTGAFLECNVRTYVTAHDKPGVFFFSLDAASKLAVRTARLGLGLPYFDAQISLDRQPDNTIAYHTTRTHTGQHPGEFTATYRPHGDIFHAPPAPSTTGSANATASTPAISAKPYAAKSTTPTGPSNAPPPKSPPTPSPTPSNLHSTHPPPTSTSPTTSRSTHGCSKPSNLTHPNPKRTHRDVAQRLF